MRNSRQIGRVITVGVLVVAITAVAVVLLGADGGTYKVTARFQSASQLVKGNLVQVAGRPVGLVTDLELSDDGQALVEMEVSEDGFVPLREGTLATIRQASLSGVANRYVDLRLPAEDRAGADIPDGGLLGLQSTSTAVDLDQLFDTFNPKARRALQKVVQGFGESYRGEGARANRGWMYLNPSLASTSRLFDELTYDTPVLDRFVTTSARLVTDVAEKRTDLQGLVAELATTTQAIAAEGASLSEAVGRLPGFMRRANTTFVNLRAALDDLDPLVEDSKPVAKLLRPFLAELRPLANDARPTLRDLATLIRRPGSDNDLVELTTSTRPLRDIAIGPVTRNGKEREGAFPASTKALAVASPELATARPYAPDLTAWFDDFGHSGVYDALGGGSRAAPNVNLFAAVDGVLQPIPPELRRQFFEASATLGQNHRCPGSIERGALWKPTPDFPCDETQVPQGR